MFGDASCGMRWTGPKLCPRDGGSIRGQDGGKLHVCSLSDEQLSPNGSLHLPRRVLIAVVVARVLRPGVHELHERFPPCTSSLHRIGRIGILVGTG